MLKVGDKVRMTKRGFKFYANLNISFDMGSVDGSMDSRHFTRAVCELFAIHGVGVIKDFNSEGEPYVIWSCTLNGVYFKYSHYLNVGDVKKLSLIDRIIFKIQGRM